jgi:hypothetical protein
MNAEVSGLSSDSDAGNGSGSSQAPDAHPEPGMPEGTTDILQVWFSGCHSGLSTSPPFPLVAS